MVHFLASSLLIQPSLVVDQVDIKPSLNVRDLGVQLRADLSVADHVSTVIRKRLLQHPSTPSTTIIDDTRSSSPCNVRSGVNCCNSLYVNAPATSTKRLQSLINMPARVLSGRSRFDHITDFTSYYLHWLPIRLQVDFKIYSMVYKEQHDLSSIYITEMIKPTSMIPRRQDLRSASRSELIISKHRTKFDEHAFIVAGPMA